MQNLFREKLPGLGLLFLGCILVPAFPAFAAEGDESCHTALVEALSGAVSITSAKGSEEAAAPGAELDLEDRLKTGQDSWADLRLCDGTGLRVGENSDFHFLEVATEEGFLNWAFELAKGSLLAVVQTEEKVEKVKFRVRTPTASLGVRGTEFLAEVEEEEGGKSATQLHTLEGEVLLGSRKDWEGFRQEKGKALAARFEPVRRAQMSSIRQGEARARRSKPFRLEEFRRKRARLFRRPLQRLKRAEALEKRRNLIRQKGRELRERARERRQEVRQSGDPRAQAVDSFRRRFGGNMPRHPKPRR